MKINLFVLLFICFLNNLKAQVGIDLGVNDPKVTLHLGNATGLATPGLQMPSYSLSELNANTSLYATDLSSVMVYINEIDEVTTDKTINIRGKGYYYFDGLIWQSFNEEKIIYLPYFIKTIPNVGNGYTLDIYEDIYKKQLFKSPINQFLSNNSSLEKVVKIDYAKNELDYVVTYYDTNVMRVNSISSNGIMNFDIIDNNYTVDSFINIILVVK